MSTVALLVNTQIKCHDRTALKSLNVLPAVPEVLSINDDGLSYLYPMSVQPRSSWWKRCMALMSLEHAEKDRQGAEGW